MNGFAPWLAALALAQGDPAPEVVEKPAQSVAPAARDAAPATAPAGSDAPARAEPAPAAAPTARPARAPAAKSTARPTSTPTTPVESTAVHPERLDSGPAHPERSGGEAPAESKGAEAAARSRRTATPTSTSTATSTATPISTPRSPPSVAQSAREQEQVTRVARAFLDALAAGDADALAAASSERFSFDGETQAGRDAVRRTWRALLAGRPGPAPRVNGLEVLPAAEAIARLGKPPARIAPLARAGVWVAIGDVGGRQVVLFVAKEGERLAVLGIHD